MPRLSELLHRPFGQLTIADVEDILERVGDAKETLFFERKREPPKDGLAKSCAAFANTYGGLLILGVEDKTDKLVGVDPVGEAQLWVKDVLRGNVIPLPPFEARWLQLPDSDKGLLLVLVEESSTTPHLLTRNGAIYRRTASSSEPVAVADQTTLFELTRRGVASVERAKQLSRDVTLDPDVPSVLYALGLAATGPEHNDIVHKLYTQPALLDTFAAPTGAVDRFSQAEARTRRAAWSQHRLVLSRELGGAMADERRLDSRIFDSGGAIGATRAALDGLIPREQGLQAVWLEEEIVPWFSANLWRGRELLTASGAHGDLFGYFALYLNRRTVFYGPSSAEEARESIQFRLGLSLDPLDGLDDAFADHLRITVRRSLGVSPPT